MKLHRLLYSIALLLIGLTANAQTQHGVVRTAGRANHGGKVLSDVIIRVDGAQNAVISDNDGTFSIRFHGLHEGDMYRLSSVKKPNYELLDQGLIGREMAFSSKVPMTIVLLDVQEMENERRAMAAKLRHTYAANYDKRIQEIEEQYDRQLISLEQKISALEETNNLYEKVQSQMNEMIDHYVRMDYDVLDSIDCEINHLIEQCEFNKAKELILSKGDINERVQAVMQLQQQTADNEAFIRRMQKQQAKLAEQAKVSQQNLLKDLQSLYDIAITYYRIDTALVFAEQMVAIAPKDLNILRDVAFFHLFHRGASLKGLRYCQQFLTASQEQYGNEGIAVVTGYFMVAGAYLMNDAVDSSLVVSKELVCHLLRHSNDSTLQGELYHVYSRIAMTYHAQKEYDSTLYYYDKAYEVLRMYPTSDMDFEMADRAYNYAWIYRDKQDYEKALIYNEEAINRFVLLGDSSHVANCYVEKSKIYTSSNRTNEAFCALYKAVEYVPSDVAPIGKSNIFNTLSDMHARQQQFDSALVYINLAMAHCGKAYKTHHADYIYYRIDRARIYTALHDYKSALNDYDTAIDDMSAYYQDSPADIGWCYRERGQFYESTGDKQKALADYEAAIAYYQQDPTSSIELITTIQQTIETINADK